MATVDATSLRSRATRLLERVGLDPVDLVVADLALVALITRLYDLGGRVVHWDEARVAYWTLRYIETGNVEYRPIIHGPFYHHVNRLVFDVFGTTAFSMRLVVALVGGLLPLTALCFRRRLSDLTVAALAGFLAFTPALVYYSRFMRGDPLVAAFCFAAFAFGVRAVDTRRRRYVLAAVGAFALGLTVKENALLYPVCWLGAAVLTVDHGLLHDREYDGEWVFLAWRYLVGAVGLLWRNALVVVAAVAEFLAIVVFFYAPRAPTAAGPGLGKAVEDPGLVPQVLWLSTGGAAAKLWRGWVRGGHQDHSYIPFFGDFLQSLAYGALALSLLAVLGFVVDRYRRDRPTTLVQFGFYWGFASVLGYPLVTDIKAPWATVNAVVALAVPAAVGFAVLVRWGATALDSADHVTFGVAALAVVVVLGQVGATTASAVYANPQGESNHLVQYAQPAGDIGPVMGVLDDAAATPGGPDIVFYGDFFVDGGPPTVPRKPGCLRWFNALPLPWYLATSGAEVSCAGNATELDATLADADTPPAVVVAREREAPNIADSLEAYEPHTYLLRLTDTPTTFFVHEDYADALTQSPDGVAATGTASPEDLPATGATSPRRVAPEGYPYSTG
ncbi:MAG: flippase activity-associated protein Agl23 [Haloarculaceae archaeon]